MTVTTEISDEDHAVELIVRDASASSPDGSAEDGAGGGSSSGSGSEEMTSLLNPSEKPKINIFSVAYSRRKPRVINPNSIIPFLIGFL